MPNRTMNVFRSIRTLAAIAAVALFVSISVRAEENGEISESRDLCKSYDRVGVSYTNSRLWSTVDDESVHLNGFALEYGHGFNLKRNVPIFIETGVKINFGFYSDSALVEGFASEKEILRVKAKDELQNIYIAVPVNLVYKIGVGKNVAIIPYVGLNLKFNAMFRERLSISQMLVGIDGNPVLDSEGNPVLDENTVSDWESLYNKDGRYGLGEKYHYQIGWQAGARIDFRGMYLGVNFGTDFTKAFRNTREWDLAVTAGFSF